MGGLRDGKLDAQRLMGLEEKIPQLVSVATDGETYLTISRLESAAYCISYRISGRGRFTASSVKIPTRDEVQILKNTSWSWPTAKKMVR